MIEEKRNIERQVSVAIVEFNRGEKFLFGGYDNTYPFEIYRGSVNF